jgi:hypothetical protein
VALAHVQSTGNIGASGGTLTAVLSFSGAVTAGNALFVIINSATGSSTRTYVVSDDVMGTTGWVRHVQRATSATLGNEIWANPNHTGGTVTISVTHNAGSGPFTAAAIEFSGFGGTVNLDASDFLNDTNVADAHVCSTSGVSSANEVIAVCSCWLEAAATSQSAGSGYTIVGSGGGQFMSGQWQHFASGCTNEQGAWTSVGTDRRGRGAIGLFSGVGGGGGGGGTPWYAYAQQ